MGTPVYTRKRLSTMSVGEIYDDMFSLRIELWKMEGEMEAYKQIYNSLLRHREQRADSREIQEFVHEVIMNKNYTQPPT